MQTDDLDRILEPFGEDLVKDLQKSLITKGVVFGGGQASKLSARIRYNIKFGDPLRFELIMPEYSEALNSGRAATSNKGNGEVTAQIESWVKRRGLVGNSDLYKTLKSRKVITRDGKTLSGSDKFNRVLKQITFLVTRKIHRHGYQGNRFYSDVINDGRVDALTIQLRDFFQQEVVIDILK